MPSRHPAIPALINVNLAEITNRVHVKFIQEWKSSYFTLFKKFWWNNLWGGGEGSWSSLLIAYISCLSIKVANRNIYILKLIFICFLTRFLEPLKLQHNVLNILYRSRESPSLDWHEIGLSWWIWCSKSDGFYYRWPGGHVIWLWWIFAPGAGIGLGILLYMFIKYGSLVIWYKVDQITFIFYFRILKVDGNEKWERSEWRQFFGYSLALWQ